MFYEQCTRTAFLWKTSGGCFWIDWSRVALFTGITKTNLANLITTGITFSWRRSLSYRNQSIDLQSKSMDWFLYDKDLRHERLNSFWLWFFQYYLKIMSIFRMETLFESSTVENQPTCTLRSPYLNSISYMSATTLIEWS